MTEVINAKFSFTDFRIPFFTYSESENKELPLKINFLPSGIYDEKKGIYLLGLIFTGTEDKEDGKVVIESKSIATFVFETALPFNQIPDYFYMNSIAIFFPYLRSFISTMTLQANCPLLLLNTMNLSNLEKPLRENTKCI